VSARLLLSACVLASVGFFAARLVATRLIREAQPAKGHATIAAERGIELHRDRAEPGGIAPGRGAPDATLAHLSPAEPNFAPIKLSRFDQEASRQPVWAADTKLTLFKLVVQRAPGLGACKELADLPPSRVRIEFDLDVAADHARLGGAHILDVVRGAPVPAGAARCVEEILGSATTLRAEPGRPFLAGYQGPIDTELDIGSAPTQH
jgi:hypothetical protein